MLLLKKVVVVVKKINLMPRTCLEIEYMYKELKYLSSYLESADYASAVAVGEQIYKTVKAIVAYEETAQKNKNCKGK